MTFCKYMASHSALCYLVWVLATNCMQHGYSSNNWSRNFLLLWNLKVYHHVNTSLSEQPEANPHIHTPFLYDLCNTIPILHVDLYSFFTQDFSA